MRRIIDGVFQAEVSGDLFGGMNVYAIAGGLPVWCNLLLAVMDEMDAACIKEQRMMSPRVQGYIDKYRKYQR